MLHQLGLEARSALTRGRAYGERNRVQGSALFWPIQVEWRRCEVAGMREVTWLNDKAPFVTVLGERVRQVLDDLL